MFIGLLGAPGSDTEAILDFLVKEYGFVHVGLSHAAHVHPKGTILYDTSDDMLDGVTSDWRGNFVTSDVESIEDIDLFIKRPFFLLITVDSNLLIKFKRFSESQKIPLEEFCRLNDDFNTQILLKHQDKSDLKLVNNVLNDSAKLAHHINSLDLLNPTRLRPSWDSYFMKFTDFAAQRCNCMRRRVGCVIVRDNRIIATGYNGTAKGVTNCNEGGCTRCNNASGNGTGVGLNTCLCLHAEENALLEAGRSRVEGGDAILYCNTCPCLTCTIKIVQCGIHEVVYSQSYSMDDMSAKVFKEAGVKFRQFVPPAHGTVVFD